MAKYPKPKGFNGGPDGTMMRQGSAGRLGWNINDFADPADAVGDRRNVSDIDCLSDSCWGEDSEC